MSSSSLYRRLLELLPAEPELAGDIDEINADGTAVVVLPGGGRLTVRNPIEATVGARVFVRGHLIIGTGPALPLEIIEI